jgi:hypothetical protein
MLIGSLKNTERKRKEKKRKCVGRHTRVEMRSYWQMEKSTIASEGSVKDTKKTTSRNKLYFIFSLTDHLRHVWKFLPLIK